MLPFLKLIKDALFPSCQMPLWADILLAIYHPVGAVKPTLCEQCGISSTAIDNSLLGTVFRMFEIIKKQNMPKHKVVHHGLSCSCVVKSNVVFQTDAHSGINTPSLHSTCPSS